MVRTVFKVLLADLIMVAAAVLVFQDVQMRTDCSLAGCTQFLGRTSPGFTYSVLTKSFSVVINGNTLVSPPTLDWLQLLVVALLLLNVWYAYVALAGKGSQASSQSPNLGSQSSDSRTMKKQTK